MGVRKPWTNAFFRHAVPQKFRGLRMKSLSAARSTTSYQQCFICRQWSWDACGAFKGTTLCLPCYVDVLEVKQARGVMGEPRSDGPRPATTPGNSLSPFRQLELFD